MKNFIKTILTVFFATIVAATAANAAQPVKKIMAADKTAAEAACLVQVGFVADRDFKIVAGSRKVAGISVGSGSKIQFANDLLRNVQVMAIAEKCRWENLQKR